MKNFNIITENGKKIVRNTQDNGTITIVNIKELSELLSDIITKNENIYFDFSNIVYIDSTGLSTIVDISRQLKKKKKKFIIYSISADVRLVFKRTKVEDFFNFE